LHITSSIHASWRTIDELSRSAKYGVGCGLGWDVGVGMLCSVFAVFDVSWRNFKWQPRLVLEKISWRPGNSTGWRHTGPTYPNKASVSFLRFRSGRVQVFVFRSSSGFRRGRGYGWSSGGKAEAVQNFSSSLRRMNRGKNSHTAAPIRAQENVNCKHSSHE
jgi:hypothetical protein